MSEHLSDHEMTYILNRVSEACDLECGFRFLTAQSERPVFMLWLSDCCPPGLSEKQHGLLNNRDLFTSAVDLLCDKGYVSAEDLGLSDQDMAQVSTRLRASCNRCDATKSPKENLTPH